MASQIHIRGNRAFPPLGHGLRHALLPLFLTALLAITAGCGTAHSPPLLTEASWDDARTPFRPIPQTEQLLARPNHFKTDFAHPEPHVLQGFRWDQRGCEWSMFLPVLHGSYASVLLRRTYDLSESRDERWLSFQIRPSYMASELSLGLLDNTRDYTSVNLARPLSDYIIAERGDWGYVLIRLDEFDAAAMSPAQLPHTRTPGALNWATVRGFKVCRRSAEGPNSDVVVRDMKIQSRGYYLPHGLVSVR